MYNGITMNDAYYYNGRKIIDSTWFSLDSTTITLYYDHPQLADVEVFRSSTRFGLSTGSFIGTFNPSSYYRGKDLHLSYKNSYSTDYTSQQASDEIQYNLSRMNSLLKDSGYTVKTLGFTSFSD